MKTFRTFALLAGFSCGVALPMWAAQKLSSDLLTPQKRSQAVETALRLTRPPQPLSLAADLPQPFSPPGFDQADPEEQKVAAAAAAAARPATSSPGSAPAPLSDRALLEAIAARIQPTGTLTLGTESLLVLSSTHNGRKNVHKGDLITVDYNGQSYDLELVSIDRTTFTLRYRAEEITRPIKPTK